MGTIERDTSIHTVGTYKERRYKCIARTSERDTYADRGDTLKEKEIAVLCGQVREIHKNIEGTFSMRDTSMRIVRTSERSERKVLTW